MSTLTFARVGALADLPPGSVRPVVVEGVEIALVRTAEGVVHAIYDECSHAQVALSEGEVDDSTIECGMHGSRFDLGTGEPIGPPATESVPVYPVRIDGDDILVALPPIAGSRTPLHPANRGATS